MKQLNWKKIKAILTSVVVTLALAAPVFLVSADPPSYNAELRFKGVGLNVMEDGSVQAIFDVSVKGAENCDGTEFYLYYNEEYLTPSYITAQGGHKQNEPLAFKSDDTDVFFQPDAKLYGKKSGDTLINPFRERDVAEDYYSHFDPALSELHMQLWLDDRIFVANGLNTESETHVGYLPQVDVHGGYYVINANPNAVTASGAGAEVILGQLSFRVNKDRVTEMLEYYNTGADNWVDSPAINGHLPLVMAYENSSKYWTISVYDHGENSSSGNWNHRLYTTVNSSQPYRNSADRYCNDFDGNTPIKAELANPNIVINAYQGYTSGTEDTTTQAGDIAFALRRYSPMVTVTYANGTKENLIVPWGMDPTDVDYQPRANKLQVLSDGTITTTTTASTAYAPTGGHYYPRQKVYIHGTLFPVPVQADLEVTPITLLNVTANDLDRSYNVATVWSEIETGNDLGLPEEARLITDIVPGGVSMTMNIPGWTPVQPDSWTTGKDPLSTWPKVDVNYDDTHKMNSLKAKNYVIPAETENYLKGTPYWPDHADRLDAASGDSTKTAKFVGSYFFTMADSYGGTPTGFLKADIQAAYPWLTVPQDKYPIRNTGTEAAPVYVYAPLEGRRHIADTSKFAPDGNMPKYTASYVKTQTDSNNDQPTATLRVDKLVGNNPSSLPATSKFRIWMPDGTEIGTGLTSKNVLTNETIKVNDWFRHNETIPDPPYTMLVEEGYYRPSQQGSNEYYYELDINPGDPNVSIYQSDRETLRRYINLGGWFSVAVCEDENTMAWSDSMPVYVEPRPNYYTETKVYNFLGENAKLMPFLSKVPTRVTMPRGTYNPVDDTGNPYYATNTDPSMMVTNGMPVDGRPTLARWEESYGLTTTYDGQTGAQPGELFKFEVTDMDYNVTPAQPTNDGYWPKLAGGKVDAQANPSNTGAAVAGGGTVTQRGATDFKSGALYEAYGYVYQVDPNNPREFGTLRTQREADAERTGVERITLTSDEPSGMSYDGTPEKNVRLAIYNTVTEGYRSRQDYVFTITNVGDVDIYGLGIDGLTDGYAKDPQGGRFEMLQAPADFLAVGESTTFILTYVYNLEANDPATLEHYYDRLYVTSDRHPNGSITGTEGDDYLRYFDAQFDVSKSKIHAVNLIVLPETEDDSKTGDDKLPTTYPMGKADIILGEQKSKVETPAGSGTYVDVYSMDYTPATRNYAAGRKVYVVVEPEDEYTLVLPVVYIDSTNTTETLTPYAWPAGTTVDKHTGSTGVDVDMVDGKIVYVFEMPDYDVTITIRFVEGIMSKMRLSDLVDYSAGPNLDTGDGHRIDHSDPADREYNKAGTADTLLKPATDPVASVNTYKVWRKSFTKDERDAAAILNDSFDTRKPGIDLCLMTMGTAIPYNAKPTPGNVFEPSHDQYLVVIPATADRSQIEATLRQVAVKIDGQGNANQDLTNVTVMMQLYGTHFMELTSSGGIAGGRIGDEEDAPLPSDMNPISNSRQIYIDTNGATATPTVHTSEVFDSPKPGESKYVRIEIRSADSATPRYYYIELHRATAEAEAQLNYGNSPYGMIMNDTETFAGDTMAESQEAAKYIFREGRTPTNDGTIGSLTKKQYTFDGQATAATPKKVREHNLKAVYWREAWVKNQQLYEPESGTGRIWTELKEDPTDTDKVTGYQWVDDPNVYDEADNLDLNDYSYFAILSEDFREPGLAWAKDSSGRYIDLSKVSVSAKVTLLDTGKTTQTDRFSGAVTKTLDLGNLTGTGYGKLLTYIPAAGDVTNANWPVERTGAATDANGVTTINYGRVENIRPGRYVITYTYLDFDGDEELKVTRPFVILTPVGDVNADLTRDTGYVTVPNTPPATGFTYKGTDEYVLENRVADPLGFAAGGAPTSAFPSGTVYPYANIFRFRVCDVNNDRNINNIDGNLIDRNVKAQAKDSQDHFIRFYHPTDYGLPPLT